jgi:endonuclease-3 related protein
MVTELVGAALKAIGVVRSRLNRLAQPDPAEVVSEVVVDPSLVEALDGLDDFSHIIVLYWMHQAAPGGLSLKVHPKGRREYPLVGLFATRSPYRPNPVGITAVRLLERRKNVLVVEGLDAFDGTPVLDIKPYVPQGDSVADARVPPWISEYYQVNRKLKDIYRRLIDCYGPQHWWPADGPFEMMVGAILTQSAAWRNVEKAIANLRAGRLLSAEALRRLPLPELAGLIHPCGYYNAKALKLNSLARWLGEACGDDLDRLFAVDAAALRQKLLSVHGVGEETADSILLYAAEKPVFVIDAYTRRIIDRLGVTPRAKGYAAYQALFITMPSLSVWPRRSAAAARSAIVAA